MPLEFSVAAFRFGHSMVRGAYDYNRNFGRPGTSRPVASFILLFAVHRQGFPAPFLGDTDALPFNWVIEWDRFVDKGSRSRTTSPARSTPSSPPPLRDLLNEGNDQRLARIKALLKQPGPAQPAARLPARHPDRPGGRRRRWVSTAADRGRAARRATARRQRRAGRRAASSTRTPLWFYVLKEAEVRRPATRSARSAAGSSTRRSSGSSAPTATPTSAASPDWDPSQGVTLPNGDPIVSIGDFLTSPG